MALFRKRDKDDAGTSTQALQERETESTASDPLSAILSGTGPRDEVFTAQQLTDVVNALGVEVYRAYTKQRATVPERMSGILHFDEHHRVTSIEQPEADGVGYTPDLSLNDTLNVLAEPLADAPRNLHVAAVEYAIAGGRLNTRIHYRQDAATGQVDVVRAEARAAQAAAEAEAAAEAFATPIAAPVPPAAAAPLSPAEQEQAEHTAAAASSAGVPQSSSSYSSRPSIVFDQMDIGPEDLRAQLPVRGELVTVRPGPDRDDYCLVMLNPPLRFTLPADFDASRFEDKFLHRGADGTAVAAIPLVVIASRFEGTQIAPDMRDLWVNLAYVTDNTLGRDESIDFSKLHYAAVARINLG